MAPASQAKAIISLEAYDYELLWNEFLKQTSRPFYGNRLCYACCFCEDCLNCFRCSHCRNCENCAFCTWQSDKKFVVFNTIQLDKLQWNRFKRNIKPLIKAFKKEYGKHNEDE